MPYEMQEILNRCDHADYKILIDVIDNYFGFTDDKRLKEELQCFEKDQSERNRMMLCRHIEKCIRYQGSSDIATLYRWLFGGQEPAGVSFGEIIEDVSKKLKVAQKKLGNDEARLERLIKAVAERTFFELSPEQQRELFQKAGLSEEQQREFFEKIKSNKTMFFPILLSILGLPALQELITGIVITVIANFLGREAAKQLIKVLTTRFPWWTVWLGPIVWGLSLTWLGFDLQSPAYRKTVPAMLYLGIVCLRNGPAEGESFSE